MLCKHLTKRLAVGGLIGLLVRPSVSCTVSCRKNLCIYLGRVGVRGGRKRKGGF